MNLAGFQQIIKHLQASYFTSFPASFFFYKNYFALTFRTAIASHPVMHKPGREHTWREGAGQLCLKCCIPEGFLLSSPAFPGQNRALLAASQTALSIKPGTSCC